MQERDRIFRFTAHELKSPLTTLRSMLAVINKMYSKTMQPEAGEIIIRAEKRADQVLFMVKDMIDITQYKQGIKKKVCEIVDFEKWLIETVNLQKDYAVNSNVNLSIKPINKKSRICIDIPSLEKVIENLVNNAIRYSPSGAVVTVEPFVKKGTFVIKVRDTGIGIPEEDLNKIFEEFYRGNNAKQMERLGTGLGLSLVKQIIEQFGGKISVESKLGEGSVFTIEMPFLQ